MTRRFYAHSADDPDHWEPLALHLEQVAERAARYAASFDAATEAQWIGLLHDLGKYSELFARRLQGKEKHLDHWSIGAWAAANLLRANGVAAAAVIEGHHIGLQSADPSKLYELKHKVSGEKRSDGKRSTATDYQELLALLEADGQSLPESFESLADPSSPELARMLDVRMLFSCLVDADYVETEAHFRGQHVGQRHYRPEGPALDAERAVATLDAHLDDLASKAEASENVRRLRTDLRRACEAAAQSKGGLFTLTAPTGTGKTLSMLAFALRHAREHRLRRVVMVIPYLTIIEQTARVYRELFKDFDENYVLEHHSLANHGPVSESDDSHPERPGRARLFAENWDAPIVVTTNVQILESLFSNRPRSCRKLHRLAKSVILFDEAQTLPANLAVPTLAALSHLSDRYGSSVVFSTATQPAFDRLDEHVRTMAPAGWKPTEAVPASLGLFQRARRVRVTWGDLSNPTPWSRIADDVARREQVLVIVNLKRHAALLVDEVMNRGVEGVFHLSTNLCPAHRKEVLDKVRRCLEQGKPCRLIATQCVEAGVDIDFPVVLRALGPLEAIAQAAGRCNRRGLSGVLGEVIVFLPEDDGRTLYPPGHYANAARVTLQMLRNGESLDIDDPDTFRKYYSKLYRRTLIAEEAGPLREAIEELDFERVAELYKVIDEDTIQVVVAYAPETFRELCESAREHRLSREWIRRARPHVVNLFRPKPSDDVWNILKPVKLANGEEAGDWFLTLREDVYDRELLGMKPAEDLWIA